MCQPTIVTSVVDLMLNHKRASSALFFSLTRTWVGFLARGLRPKCWSLLTVTDSFQESQTDKLVFNHMVRTSMCIGSTVTIWVWNSNDPSSVHTRRSGPKETSSPGLKSLVQRAKVSRVIINLFSWNQVHVSYGRFGKSFRSASCWKC